MIRGLRRVVMPLLGAWAVTAGAARALPNAGATLAARHDASAAARTEAAGDVSMYSREWLRSGAVDVRVLLDALAEWLATERDGWILHEITLALVLLDDDVPPAWWAPFLDHADPGVRAAAAEGVAAALTAELESRLLRLNLAESFDWVRAARVGALRAGTSEASLRALHEALSDPSPDVRGAASVALRSRADRTSTPFLLRAMSDPALQGAENAVAALGTTHDPAALPVLVSATTSESWQVRELAAIGLGWFGASETVPPLARLLRDPARVVREAAAQALVQIGSVPAAFELLSDLATFPGEFTFEDGRAIAPDGAEDALLAASGLSDVTLLGVADDADKAGGMERAFSARVSALARTLAGFEGSYLVTWSTGDLHSELYSARNASSRVVSPRGAYAEGWDLAIGSDRGGTRTWLRRGRTVTAWDRAVVDGQEWVQVHDGPYATAWVRAEDVRLPRSYRPPRHARPSGSRTDGPRAARP